MIPTRMLAGSDDLTLNEWVIIEVQRPVEFADEEQNITDLHIFGWCPDTGVYQLSSKILEETDNYIRTRSRKYFKEGPSNSDKQGLQAITQLVRFLHSGWGTDLSIVKSIVEKHSIYDLSDEGIVRLNWHD